jgi:hypothetical protein
MSEEHERVLAALERALEFARAYRLELDDDYRALIARAEALPANQSGADKSGRWLGSPVDAAAIVEAFSRAPRR